MVKRKIKFLISSTLMCSLLLSQGYYAIPVQALESDTTIKTTNQVKANTKVNDDFYNTINYDWLHSAKIPTGKTYNSASYEATENIKNQTKEIIKELLAHEKNYAEDSDEKRIINLYKNTLNMDARNKQGNEPIKEVISEINNIKSVKDISALSMDSNIINSIIGMNVRTDSKNSNKKALYISCGLLGLGNSDEYTKLLKEVKKINS